MAVKKPLIIYGTCTSASRRVHVEIKKIALHSFELTYVLYMLFGMNDSSETCDPCLKLKANFSYY